MRASRHLPLLTSPLPLPLSVVAHPYARSYPPTTRSSDERANASLSFPLVSLLSSLSSFLPFPFSSTVLPSPGVYFSPPCALRLCSLFARFLDDSLLLAASAFLTPTGTRSPFSPVICFGSIRRPSPFTGPRFSALPFSSDSSWRVSSPLRLQSRAYARSACVQYRVACKDEELNKLLKAVTCHAAAGVYTPKG